MPRQSPQNRPHEFINDQKANIVDIGHDVTFGSKDYPTRSILIAGNIKSGVKIQVYGWDLHVAGNIEDGVTIEFMSDFKGEDRSKLCVRGNIGKKVTVTNPYLLKVSGEIQDDSQIHAGGNVQAQTIGNHVKLTSKVGKINCGDVGNCSLVQSHEGEQVSCGNIGKNSKVQCHNNISVKRVEEKSRILSYRGTVTVESAHASVCVHSLGTVEVKERFGKKGFMDHFKHCLFSSHSSKKCKEQAAAREKKGVDLRY